MVIMVTWLSVVISGFLWLAEAVRGCRWLPVVLWLTWLSWLPVHGYQWFSMVSRGCAWISRIVGGYQWFYGYHGYQWLSMFSMVNRGCAWISRIVGGYQWLSLVFYGLLCSCLVLCHTNTPLVVPLSTFLFFRACTHEVRLFGLFILHFYLHRMQWRI